jgi:hypothetical protein
MEYRIKRSKIDFVELKSFVESVVVKQCRWDVKKVTGAVMHVREPPRNEGHKFSLYYYDSSRPHRNNRTLYFEVLRSTILDVAYAQ